MNKQPVNQINSSRLEQLAIIQIDEAHSTNLMIVGGLLKIIAEWNLKLININVLKLFISLVFLYSFENHGLPLSSVSIYLINYESHANVFWENITFIKHQRNWHCS